MKERTEAVINEARGNLRIKENRRVAWRTNKGETKGVGRIVNISASGMLLETNSTFEPYDNCRFSFDADLGEKNFVPQSGQLMWFKKKQKVKNGYLCGIKFVEPADHVLTQLRQRVQKGIKHFTHMRQLNSVANVGLTAAIIGLTGYVIWESSRIYENMNTTNQRLLGVSAEQAVLTQSYSDLYVDSQTQLSAVSSELTSAKSLYQESQKMVESITQELNATKAILTETEALLAKAQESNSVLQADLNSLSEGNSVLKNELGAIKEFHSNQMETNKAELQATIAQLESKNVQFSTEMNSLKEQLDFYAGNIKTSNEGKALVLLYRNRIKNVKSKIREIKKEAHLVRRTALKEQDQIRMKIGNNGYFVRNGKDVKVDLEKFRSVGTSSPVKNVTKDNVEIDVTFFE